MRTTSLLAQAFDLALNSLHQNIRNAACAICGEVHHAGLPARDVIKSGTAEIADIFKLPTAWVCGACAACFGDSRTLVGGIFATPTVAIKPMVSTASATAERPAWRDLVRDEHWLGVENVGIVTLNTKRRLWPSAVTSVFGEAWRPLFVDGDIVRLLHINVRVLREYLALIEEVYAAGFAKPVIGKSLYDGLSGKRIAEVGLERIRDWERRLADWRSSDEFILALFIAQKDIES